MTIPSCFQNRQSLMANDNLTATVISGQIFYKIHEKSATMEKSTTTTTTLIRIKRQRVGPRRLKTTPSVDLISKQSQS